MLIYTPGKVLDAWREHYLEYTWERSRLTEQLLADRMWRLGHKFKDAKGSWADVYTVTETVLLKLQEKLLSDWKTNFPREAVRQALASDLAQNRPNRSVPDDPEMGDMSIGQQYCLFLRFLLHWVLPQVDKEFGEAGKQEVENAAGAWQPWFVSDLRYGVLKKRSGSNFRGAPPGRLAWHSRTLEEESPLRFHGD